MLLVLVTRVRPAYLRSGAEYQLSNSTCQQLVRGNVCGVLGVLGVLGIYCRRSRPFRILVSHHALLAFGAPQWL